MEKIRCICGKEARVVESGIGVYINCPFCGADTYPYITKGEAIQKFREDYGLPAEITEAPDEEDCRELEKTEAGTEILVFAGYPELEAAGDRAAGKIKEGFMEMGCVMKVARDTDILAGSKYRSYEEFGGERYGLDKGTISRYIRIVERFSVGGNSNVLRDNYKNMGYTKLSIMLHMPDAIAEELMESLSKAEVAMIREEIEAEEQISDIELAIEAAEAQPEEPETEKTLLEKIMLQIGKEQPEIYKKIWAAFRAGEGAYIKDVLAPQGDAVYIARPEGIGRHILTIPSDGSTVSVTIVRSREKEKYSMEELEKAAEGICRTDCGTAEESYHAVYGEEMELQIPQISQPTEKAEVAPVQQSQKDKRKQSKVIKAKPTPKKQPVPVEKEEEMPEDQLPGQMSVEDYEGIVPSAREEIPGTGAVEISEEREETDGEELAAGDEPPAEGGDGSPAAAVTADRDTPEESAESDRTAESGGCEEDHGAGEYLMDGIWEKIRKLFLIRRDYSFLEEIPLETVKEAYQDAIDLAAGLEKLLIARGGSHE